MKAARWWKMALVSTVLTIVACSASPEPKEPAKPKKKPDPYLVRVLVPQCTLTEQLRRSREWDVEGVSGWSATAAFSVAARENQQDANKGPASGKKQPEDTSLPGGPTCSKAWSKSVDISSLKGNELDVSLTAKHKDDGVFKFRGRLKFEGATIRKKRVAEIDLWLTSKASLSRFCGDSTQTTVKLVEGGTRETVLTLVVSAEPEKEEGLQSCLRPWPTKVKCSPSKCD